MVAIVASLGVLLYRVCSFRTGQCANANPLLQLGSGLNFFFPGGSLEFIIFTFIPIFSVLLGTALAFYAGYKAKEKYGLDRRETAILGVGVSFPAGLTIAVLSYLWTFVGASRLTGFDSGVMPKIYVLLFITVSGALLVLSGYAMAEARQKNWR